jgi:hypothetical protein
MELKRQFNLLKEFFEREKIDYALIGAFALYAYGYTRATCDLDFITRIESQNKIITYLESLGFETLQKSEGYSNHQPPVGFAGIDLVYVGGETAKIIFKAVRQLLMFENLNLPVVSPEHLIALKLFAIKNEPKRKFKELADIKEVLQHTPLDKEVIRDYFKKYRLEAYYDEVVEE